MVLLWYLLSTSSGIVFGSTHTGNSAITHAESVLKLYIHVHALAPIQIYVCINAWCHAIHTELQLFNIVVQIHAKGLQLLNPELQAYSTHASFWSVKNLRTTLNDGVSMYLCQYTDANQDAGSDVANIAAAEIGLVNVGSPLRFPRTNE